MAVVPTGGSTPKRRYKPVTVKATKSARKANIPVQRAVREINSAVGTQVARTTKSRAKADVLVKAQRKVRAESFGKKYAIGTASRIPKNRAGIEQGKTVVKITPRAARAPNVFQNSEPGSSKASISRRRRVTKGHGKKNVGYPSVVAHELGHSLGLPDRYPTGSKETKKFKKSPNYRSVMGYGNKLTGYDVRDIKRTTGAGKVRRKGTTKFQRGQR